MPDQPPKSIRKCFFQKHAVLAGTNSNLHESVFVEHPGKTQKRWQSIIALFSFHNGPPNFRRRRPPYKMNASWKARQSVRPAGNLARNFVNTSHSAQITVRPAEPRRYDYRIVQLSVSSTASLSLWRLVVLQLSPTIWRRPTLDQKLSFP